MSLFASGASLVASLLCLAHSACEMLFIHNFEFGGARLLRGDEWVPQRRLSVEEAFTWCDMLHGRWARRVCTPAARCSWRELLDARSWIGKERVAALIMMSAAFDSLSQRARDCNLTLGSSLPCMRYNSTRLTSLASACPAKHVFAIIRRKRRRGSLG